MQYDYDILTVQCYGPHWLCIEHDNDSKLNPKQAHWH